MRPLKHGEPVVVVCEKGRTHQCQLDILPNFVPEGGWVTVSGWSGRAGPVSVRTGSVFRVGGGKRTLACEISNWDGKG